MPLNVGVLDLNELDQDYYVVAQLRTQPAGVIHAMTLMPSKVKQIMRECPSCGTNHKTGIIRLGDTPGDEAVGWQLPQNIHVLAVLGKAEMKDGKLVVSPLE